MANANRFRHGPRNLISVPVASATVLEKGDFVLIIGGKAVSARQYYGESGAGAEGSSVKNVRSKLMQYFSGVADEPSPSGSTDPILVDISTEAIFEFVQGTAEDCSVGDLISILANSTASSSWTPTDDSVSVGGSNPFAVCVRDHDSAQGTGILCKLLPQKVFNAASWAT